eukprot:10156403-Alexandrium_andersonii.AAC.1
MKDVWLEWAKYGELKGLARNTTAKQHFFQDRWTYRVVDLGEQMADDLIEEEGRVASKGTDSREPRRRGCP